VNEERLGSPIEFAERLAQHLANAEGSWPLPDAGELVELVQAAFFASLHEEEARRTEFSIAWQRDARACVSVVAVGTPVLITPKSLAKLAPATRRDATSIALRRERGALVAWALIEQSAAAEQPLTIRVLGAGVLRVEYAGTACALYARGEMYFMGSDVKSPVRALTRTFAAWGDDDPRAAAVTRIASRALQHGHGGMILLIPANVAAPLGVRVHYAVDDGANVLIKRHDTAIDLVARLTAIDNAVLLDTDLRLRGFGVQVIEGDAPDMTFEHVNPYSDDLHTDDLTTFKGTRHPAGVIFCMRQEREAAAIIASQDGRLSLATKSASGTVQVLGSYERGFGWS